MAPPKTTGEGAQAVTAGPLETTMIAVLEVEDVIL
jgi:hypothetical protein